MTRKLYSLLVRGKQFEWRFDVWDEPRYIEERVRDGLHITEVLNECPEWVAHLHLVDVWFFFQDLFGFRNPFKKDNAISVVRTIDLGEKDEMRD